MSEEINESRPVHLECFQEIHRLNDKIKLLELKAHATARAQEKGIKRLHSGKKKLLKENNHLIVEIIHLKKQLEFKPMTTEEIDATWRQLEKSMPKGCGIKAEDL